jgi:hypothetical protein
MRVDYKLVAGFAVGLVTSLLSFGVGIWMATGHTADDLDKFAFSLLSMLGSWVSGIGALGAVVVALYVAVMQIRDAKMQDAVRCIHHAMAIANDLRSRVHYLQTTLVAGGRPLAALTLNVEAISRRYEALYDRDLYRHLPGPVIDKITGMSASFFGIETLATGIASALKNEQHAQLRPAQNVGEAQINAFELLVKDLDDLFTELQVERKKLA